MTAKKTQAQTVAEWREKLGTDTLWAERGILAIYKYQTADEQSAQAVRGNNNVGFTVHDAHILSSFAKQLLEKIERFGPDKYAGDRLSPRQMKIALDLMPKYAKQLHNHHKNKERTTR